MQGYPVHGWVLSGADNVDSLAAAVGAACMRLQALDVPHNLLICDAGSRVLLWPQCFATKQARGEVPDDVLATGAPLMSCLASRFASRLRSDMLRGRLSGYHTSQRKDMSLSLIHISEPTRPY